MTARAPGDDDADDAGWSALHGGVQPSRVVRGWLSIVRILASGPIAKVPPDILSVFGVLALVGAWAAEAGPGWPALTVLLVLTSGLLDGLDGAVALRTGKARPLGAVIDSVADRLGDLLLGAVLLALGAPPAWVAAALALVLLLEYVRARAQAVGMP
ncbi:MAG: CDP-alcohol phosphatidyltransferase family protein, partial [Mycobacterium sp.]